ncbi:MAG: hypothetical protein JNK82_03255 [Myxococcaceae bacterium]|nr:hypothetical protein [Myxococcaceae bacterium]
MSHHGLELSVIVAEDLELGTSAEPAGTSAPVWLFDIELPSPAGAAPAVTPPMPARQREALRQKSVEVDPFEAFLKSTKVTANEPHALAEPTVVDANPLGAGGERWWIDPTPSAPRAQVERETAPAPTPPQWKTKVARALPGPRPTPPASPKALAQTQLPPPLPPRRARVMSLMGGIVVGGLAVLLLGASVSSAATDLLVPAPPEATRAAVLAPEKFEPAVEEKVVAPPPVERPKVKSAAKKRELAKKKWDAEVWPAEEVKPAPAAEEAPAPTPEPAPIDDLKRPEF